MEGNDARLSALHAAIVGLHWLAVQWGRFPRVAAELRYLADELSARVSALEKKGDPHDPP